MSSATNHKKRSRRGYKMQTSFLAPKNSPMIRQTKPNVGRMVRGGLLQKIFRRMMGLPY